MLYLYTAKSGGSLSLALAPPGSRKRSGDERLGWSETKVVIRFWIISAAFASLGFALYFQLG